MQPAMFRLFHKNRLDISTMCLFSHSLEVGLCVCMCSKCIVVMHLLIILVALSYVRTSLAPLSNEKKLKGDNKKAKSVRPFFKTLFHTYQNCSPRTFFLLRPLSKIIKRKRPNHVAR